MVCADYFCAFGPRRMDRREVICRIDQIARRPGFEVSRANIAQDGVRSAYEQAATFARGFLTRMSEHIGHDETGNGHWTVGGFTGLLAGTSSRQALADVKTSSR